MAGDVNLKTDAKTPDKPAGIPPVDPNYTAKRIAAQDARKEAARKGSSRPAPKDQ